jgi:transmembrane sensor
MPFLQQLVGDQVQSFATAPSEHRAIELSDGSRITLGARTELTVHYTAKRRFIFLDRGEAWFAVAHNSLRPFTVFAGGGSITAIGTQFDVRREEDPTDIGRVVVTVSNGTVEVGPPKETIETISKGTPELNHASGLKRPNPPEWTPARLVKGQGLTYGTDGPQGKIESVNLEEVSAWKEGRLEYRHTPFREVIPRVNRYSAKRIVLADDAVGELPYSGTVFEGQVDDWLHALQTTYPIEVTETADHFVIHYDRDREKSGE